MPKRLDFRNLRLCLDEYASEFLFIRLTGSSGGTIKVNQELNNKKLDFRKNKNGLYMLIDNTEVFHFPLKDYTEGFSLGYERIQPTKDGVGRQIVLSTGIDPYDSNLPEPRKSILRTILDNHLMEISFKGRIDLKFHSWWIKPDWKYWTVEVPKK